MRGEIYNEGEYGAKSTFTSILGREACYSAQILSGRMARITLRESTNILSSQRLSLLQGRMADIRARYLVCIIPSYNLRIMNCLDTSPDCSCTICRGDADQPTVVARFAGLRLARHFDPQRISICLRSKSYVFLASNQLTPPRRPICGWYPCS